MVRQPIEQRGCHFGIAEHQGPFAEREVGGHHDRGLLVEPADQVEQQLAARQRERQIAQLVEDHQVEPGQMIGNAPRLSCAGFSFEPVHQVNGVIISDPRADAYARASDRNGKVGFSGPGSSYQHGIALVGQESAGGQMLDSGMEPDQVEEEKVAMRSFLLGLTKNPTPYEEWGSDGKLARNTYLWWAHAVKLRLSDSLRRVEAPVLVLHGISDQGTPFRSTEILLEELTYSGKTDVEFQPYDGGHSPPPERVQEALDWALERLGN